MAYRRQKISQMPPKGANLDATDLLEISEVSGTGYITKSITGQEIIDAASGGAFVPYTGATANVDLGTFHLDAAKGTFTHSGSTDTLTATHSSGAGIGLLITKGGNNEGLKVNKTSGSGNAATIIGTLEATTLVKTGGTSAQFLMADGSTSLGGGITVGTTAVTSGTIGRVFFQGSGDVVQQSASLFWDNTNSRLGVGATPASTVRLDVRAQGALSTDIAFRVRNSADTANLFNLAGNGLFTIGGSNTYQINFNPVSPTLRGIGINGSSIAWQLSPWSGEFNVLALNSHLGIGTSAPSDKVHIYSATNGYFMRIGVGASAPANESCGIRFSTTWAGTTFGGDAAQIIARTKGTTLTASQKSSLEFNLNSGGTTALKASITSQSNLLLQSPTEDTNDIGVIYIPNGTVPAASIVNGYKQYSADITAGNAAPHFRTENGAIVKVYQETTGVGASTLATGLGTPLTDTDTFDGYTLKQIVKALRNQGLLA
jgi:hypothetical protein